MADSAKRTVGAGGKLEVSRGRFCESGCRRTRIGPKELQQASRTCVPGTGYAVSLNRMLRRHVPMNGTHRCGPRVSAQAHRALLIWPYTSGAQRTRSTGWQPSDATDHISLAVKLPRRRGQAPGEVNAWGSNGPAFTMLPDGARSINAAFEPFSHDGLTPWRSH